ncbi:hypothetical protein [Saccharopolyspora cebuensis]|uniref:Peptidase inhibitor family I36 n=1 Tax=Saccharopolyspora cebuensis TaxID=418759 RepID=A0ABV4CEK3_9PSEU
MNSSALLAKAAVVGLSLSALLAPAASGAERSTHPLAFQGAGVGVCDRGTYCIYESKNYNEEGPGAPPLMQVWQHDGAWKDFRKHPVTGQPFVPDATNRVRSVSNDLDRTIYFMEWEWGDPGSGVTECIAIPPHSAVRDVLAQGSDGGYGSVSLDPDLARQYGCRELTPDSTITSGQ